MNLMGDRISREIAGEVAEVLRRMGVFFRIFARLKDPESAKEKIERRNYGQSTGKKLQDVVGVRVALYFSDDVEIVRRVLVGMFGNRFVSETVDSPSDDSFQPRRLNMIVRLRPEWTPQVSLIREFPNEIDETYELQLRTILSEGWHEVEHDLRYKAKADWDAVPDMSRVLNGVLASLENCDWSMLQVFDKLAYRHYKQGQWASMVRNKFRLRGLGEDLSAKVSTCLTENPDAAKMLIRAKREKVLLALANDVFVPLTQDNLVFLMNHVELKDPNLRSLVPAALQEQFDRIDVGDGTPIESIFD